MSLRALLDTRLLPVLLVAAIVIVLPLFFPSAYYYRIGALVFIFALAVVGLNLLMGFAGQVSLGHAGFLGIGAYAVAIGPGASWRAVLALPVRRRAALGRWSRSLSAGRSSSSKGTISPSPRSASGCSSPSC